LGAAAAVYHTVDFWAIFVENAAYDWSVGAGGGEDHLAGIDADDNVEVVVPAGTMHFEILSVER